MTTTRRRFLVGGSAAAVCGVVTYAQGRQGRGGGGAAAAAKGKLAQQVHAELREGLRLLREKDPAGARQLATTLRLYAATLDDATVQAALKKMDKRAIKDAWIKHDHAEFHALAAELGIPLSEVPTTIDVSNADAAIDRLRAEGLTPFMRESAEALDAMAALLASKTGQATVGMTTVKASAARQCADCLPVCNAAIQAAELASAICLASRVFPPLVELCVAAGATWLTFSTACGICQLISCTRWGA